jgi:hypothetical protein
LILTGINLNIPVFHTLNISLGTISESFCLNIMEPEEELRSFSYSETVAGVEHNYRVTQNGDNLEWKKTALSLPSWRAVTIGGSSPANL